MKLDFIPRVCPLCGGEDASVIVEATLCTLACAPGKLALRRSLYIAEKSDFYTF
jgi:hypothetical protein